MQVIKLCPAVWLAGFFVTACNLQSSSKLSEAPATPPAQSQTSQTQTASDDETPAPEASQASTIQSSSPQPTANAGSASFASDWTSDYFKGGWRNVQVVSSDRLGLDPQVTTWHGFAAARVEVRPGDDPLNLHHNSERAEVLTMQDASHNPLNENASSGTQYFAMSYLFPADWQSTVQSTSGTDWSSVFQLHGPDVMSAPPSIALEAGSDFNVHLYGGNLSTVSPHYPTIYHLSDGSMNLGAWTDIVIMITFKADPTGHVTVWRRNQGQSSFTRVLDLANVATLQYNNTTPLGDHYWKQGLYRGLNHGITNIFWMGPLARASTFEAAEAAAFGTAAGQP